MVHSNIILRPIHGFILVSMILLSSCSFFTSPDPYVNEDAKPISGGVKIYDHSSHEICYDGKQIVKGQPWIDLVPDLSSSRIIIDNIEIDSTNWMAWRDGNIRVEGQTVKISPFNGVNGNHRFTFFVRMYDINSGLELRMGYETLQVAIVLNLKDK